MAGLAVEEIKVNAGQALRCLCWADGGKAFYLVEKTGILTCHLVEATARRSMNTMIPLDSSRRSFLKTSVAVAGTIRQMDGSLAARSGPAAGPLLAYVGTFSSPLRDVLPTQVDLPPGNGRGIHHFQVDRATGAMSPAGVHEMGTSPSCLALNAAGTRLYSANETDRVGDDKEGTVSAFSIQRAVGKLELLNTVRSGGAGPTHLSVHPSGRFVLVANYFGGSVAVLPILRDGRLGPATDIKNDAGKLGPTRATNAPPGSFAVSGHDRTHAHMIQADPTGRFVLHVDLGLDKIFVWKFDDQKGLLTPNEPPAVALPPGDGPRHFPFSPQWPLALLNSRGKLDRRLVRLRRRSRPASFAADHLHPATWVCRQQLLLRDPGLRRRAVCLRRQSAWDPLESTCRHASLSIL